MNIEKKYGEGAELIWSDRKRFWGMPLSFTRYRLIRKPGSWFKLFSDIGFTYSEVEELNLYRVCDISFRQSLFGKLFDTGSVILRSNDSSMPTLTLRNIKNPFKVRDMLSEYIEQERKVHGVRLTEQHRHGGS